MEDGNVKVKMVNAEVSRTTVQPPYLPLRFLWYFLFGARFYKLAYSPFPCVQYDIAQHMMSAAVIHIMTCCTN
jgi:hypothetical protein